MGAVTLLNSKELQDEADRIMSRLFNLFQEGGMEAVEEFEQQLGECSPELQAFVRQLIAERGGHDARPEE